jgi:hypothetical protein
MSGVTKSTRSCVVALVTTALVLGINGFVGAIHSVHHLPAAGEPHSHGEADQGHDREEGRPHPAAPGAPDTSCPVAAAALHLAAIEVAALPVLAPSSAEAEVVAPRAQNSPRQASREPGSGRAPPSFLSLPS